MSKRLDENLGSVGYDGLIVANEPVADVLTLGAKHLKDAKADNDESGAAGVGAAPNGGEEGSESDDKAKVDAIVGLYNSTKSQNGGKK